MIEEQMDSEAQIKNNYERKRNKGLYCQSL